MLIETDQLRETRWRGTLGGRVTALLHSLRCAEAQQQDLPGQDYARLVVHGGGSRIGFCVCDGVGSSYRGDFAARVLGIRLVDWLMALKRLPLVPPTSQTTPEAHELAEAMEQWAREAQEGLLAAPRPRARSAIECEVLDELREQYGSETVFLAGQLDFEGSPATVRLLLCWMGNVRAYFQHGDSSFAIGDDDQARWSTARGVRGKVWMRAATVTAPWRLVIHSDGLDALDGLGDATRAFTEAELIREEQRLLRLPTSDDMTLLALECAAPADLSRSE